MKRAHFRFYAELNDFFAKEKKGQLQEHYFKGKQSIKDRIESLGVPHPEVFLIIVNGSPVDFSYYLKDNDFVSVYPVFKSITIDSDFKLRADYKEPYQFVLDVHLGKLANYLRMLGFDTYYRNDYADAKLAQISDCNQRILLTRDCDLLKRKRVTYGYYIREDDPQEQLYSVLKRYNLFSKAGEKGRCIHCNSLLVSVAKEKIIDRLEAKTKKYYQDFYLCPQCDQIYWQGSHYQNMKNLISKLKNNS